MDDFIDKSQDIVNSSDFKTLDVIFQQLNHHLTLRSYFVGHKPSVADIAIWGALKANAIFARQIKTGKDLGAYLGRWFNHMSAQAFVEASLADVAKANDNIKVVSLVYLPGRLESTHAVIFGYTQLTQKCFKSTVK